MDSKDFIESIKNSLDVDCADKLPDLPTHTWGQLLENELTWGQLNQNFTWGDLLNNLSEKLEELENRDPETCKALTEAIGYAIGEIENGTSAIDCIRNFYNFLIITFSITKQNLISHLPTSQEITKNLTLRIICELALRILNLK